MKALYRKYRPTKLSEVCGQERVVKPLENALKAGKFSHAYLFTGPRGCGKTSVARIFAHLVNDFPYEIEDSYVDIIEIDAASNTGVDNIRDLREKATIAPTEGKYKVYIIDEVHMLSKAAFNALLKTLEEPPKSVIFIMATTDAYKVPITITSRAQVFNFELASPDIMLKHLEKIAKAEKIDIAKDALEVIVERGGGSFRDSISLLDQISTLEAGKIDKKIVLDALGLPEKAKIRQLLDAYGAGDLAQMTDLLQNALKTGEKPEILAENLISEIIKNPEPKLLPLLEKLPEVKNPYPEAKILLAFLGESAERPILRENPREVTNTALSEKTAQNAPETPKTAKSAPETEVASTVPPKPEPTSETEVASEKSNLNAPDSAFDWQTFLETVKTANSAIFAILDKCIYEKQGQTLKIFCERKTHRIILNSANNQRIITAALPAGYSVEIHNSAEHLAKDSKTGKISDIMGEITEVSSTDSPF